MACGAGGLAGCGFAPAYAPGSAGAALRGRLDLSEPRDLLEFAFADQVEARLGRAPGAPLLLEFAIDTEVEGLAVTPDQEIQRYNLVGVLDYTVRERGSDGRTLKSGRIDSFTAYSAIGTTVATRASQTDANRRLAVILADLLVNELLATAGDWMP